MSACCYGDDCCEECCMDSHFTTPTPLREALATALRVVLGDYPVTTSNSLMTHEEAADAILARPSMQAVAEHEAGGRAVARLPMYWKLIRAVNTAGPLEWMVKGPSGEWACEPTIPEAIAAALGPSEGERTEAGT